MIGVNRVTLLGNLGADPEVKKFPSGQTMAFFSLATSNAWTNREGQKQEHTEWHRIVVWGKLAETCAEYLSKGKKAYVEGRAQTRSWEDEKGQKRYTTEIVANQVLFLGDKPTEKKTSSYTNEPAFGRSSDSSAQNPQSESSATSETEADDIPF